MQKREPPKTPAPMSSAERAATRLPAALDDIFNTIRACCIQEGCAHLQPGSAYSSALDKLFHSLKTDSSRPAFGLGAVGLERIQLMVSHRNHLAGCECHRLASQMDLCLRMLGFRSLFFERAAVLQAACTVIVDRNISMAEPECRAAKLCSKWHCAQSCVEKLCVKLNRQWNSDRATIDVWLFDADPVSCFDVTSDQVVGTPLAWSILSNLTCLVR